MPLRPLLLLALLAIASPSFAAAPVPYPTESPEKQVARLQHRLEEIKAMDMHKLSREEKKALRVEVKAIKKEMSGGVYLSVGAIILIVLLILLLA